jgi:sulfide:quinone oxidoreductase
MKNLLVLGAGSAGTMAANKLFKKLDKNEWTITVVDQDNQHLYQPGLLLLPFGVYEPKELVKSREQLLRSAVDFIVAKVSAVHPEQNTVELEDGRTLDYDFLIIASGTTPRPDQTPGLMDPAIWYKSAFDFYTLAGSVALRHALSKFEGGRLVVHISEMPIKCPVAPLEFTFLADAYFEERKMRDQVEITYVTPLEGAFTKPVSSEYLSHMLKERNIRLEPNFVVDRIDPQSKTLVSMDERQIPFDLLVTVPVNMGANFVGASGMGNDLNYLPVDKETFLSKKYDDIFALGDASDIPASKAGSVAHFAIDLSWSAHDA